jgi:hypothetical protein
MGHLADFGFGNMVLAFDCESKEEGENLGEMTNLLLENCDQLLCKQRNASLKENSEGKTHRE